MNSTELQRYMADLEERIDPEQEDRILSEWLGFADGHLKKGFFAPSRKPAAPKVSWQHMLVNTGLESDVNMIYQQLQSLSQILAAGSGEVLSIRSNFGTSILPAMFGAPIFIMPDNTDTLPGSKPLPDAEHEIARFTAGKAYNPELGYAPRVFSMAETWLELVRPFPKLKKYVSYYNPDLQGPLPLVEALWGSEFYSYLLDDEDSALVTDALDLFTTLYLDFTRRWHALCPTFDAEHSVEWGCLHRGGTIIRNDAAMNISGEMYRAFVMPRDQRIISECGGGIHFCGRGHHYIQQLAQIDGLSCINMSEPKLNDMETIYTNTVDKGILIFGMPAYEVDRATAAGRDLHGLVHRGASVAAWVQETRK